MYIFAMRTTSVSNLRKNLASELDRVTTDHEPLIVHRNGNKSPVVVMSLEDFGTWDETAYLLSGAENARRLLESIKQADEGKLIPFELPD